ncbi:caveolin-2-like [Diadema setosum]|uniref:caveolin-2-like n=1 Tax=Diadema setosum TaxID=31175 RepID=UPI003B3BB6C4
MVDKQGPYATTGAVHHSPAPHVITRTVPVTTVTQHESNQEQAANDSEDIYNLKLPVNMTYEDTFKESETAAGFPFMKSVNKNIFRCTHFALYGTLTMIISPLISFLWAVIFALLHMVIVWFFQPCFKTYFTLFKMCSVLLKVPVQLLINPIFRSMSLILSSIRGRSQLAKSGISVTSKTSEIQDV